MVEYVSDQAAVLNKCQWIPFVININDIINEQLDYVQFVHFCIRF
jgi:hypothetical protein